MYIYIYYIYRLLERPARKEERPSEANKRFSSSEAFCGADFSGFGLSWVLGRYADKSDKASCLGKWLKPFHGSLWGLIGDVVNVQTVPESAGQAVNVWITHDSSRFHAVAINMQAIWRSRFRHHQWQLYLLGKHSEHSRAMAMCEVRTATSIPRVCRRSYSSQCAAFAVCSEGGQYQMPRLLLTGCLAQVSHLILTVAML